MNEGSAVFFSSLPSLLPSSCIQLLPPRHSAYAAPVSLFLPVDLLSLGHECCAHQRCLGRLAHPGAAPVAPKGALESRNGACGLKLRLRVVKAAGGE